MKTFGPVHRHFAWHPVNTEDRGWRWLRMVNRRRITLDHDFGTVRWWAYSVAGR